MKFLERIYKETVFILKVIFTILAFKIIKINNKNNTKSLALLGQAYYSFSFLAHALRKINWKVIVLDLYPPHPRATLFSFGESHNLYNKDSYVYRHNLEQSYLELIKNYDMVTFYGSLTVFPDRSEKINYFYLILLKMSGVKIGYTATGCLDGATQKEIYKITDGLCEHCVWRKNALVCNDQRNLRKKRFIRYICDVYFREVDWKTELARSKIGVSMPLTLVSCKDNWGSKIIVPDKFLITKDNNEQVIILTAFGNEDIRASNEIDIKGKKEVFEAINNIKAKGYNIKHIHCNNIESKNFKYIQAQADIVIDQIKYGTIGAFSRECMMLGKPVICYIAEKIRKEVEAMKDCPIISSSVADIEPILEQTLLLSNEDRLIIGKKSREWMIKWYDAQACAVRYDKIYDNLKKGLLPTSNL